MNKDTIKLALSILQLILSVVTLVFCITHFINFFDGCCDDGCLKCCGKDKDD